MTESVTKLINTAHESRNYGDVDTSFLYEELRREYAKKEQELEVNFRNLASWVKLGDQFTHQIHPYPAKLLPHISNFFLNASSISKAHSIVLDPFCGSGTVALEASLAKRQPYVADANPLARLITKVKTTRYDTAHLRLLAMQIIHNARKYRVAPIIDVVNSALWYSADRKKKLELILRAINEIDSDEDKDFFKACFSVLVRKFSNADPAISVPVRLKEKESFSNEINRKIKLRLNWIDSANPIDEFYKICELNIYRIEITNSAFPTRMEAQFVGTDARSLHADITSNDPKPLANNSIPLTITSPPYGSAQKYIRATSLSLNWLGMASVSDLAKLESMSIGREHITLNHKLTNVEIPDQYRALIHEISKINQKRADITEMYFAELASAISEISRITQYGGHVVFVVGNNSVSGRVVRNDLFITDIFKSHGLNLEMSLNDGIKSRGLMTKRNKTASIISKETVLVFSKPKNE